MPLRKASAPPAASGNQPIHDTFFFILAAKTSVLCPSVARHPQQNKTQYLLPNSHCQFPSLWQHTALTELHPFVGFSPVDRTGLPPVPQPLTRRSSDQRWQFFTEAPPPQTVEQRRPPPTVIIMVFAFHRVSAQSVQPAGLEISHRNYEDYTTSLAHFYALLTQRCFFEASPPQRPPAPADPHFFQRDAQRAQRLMMAAFN